MRRCRVLLRMNLGQAMAVGAMGLALMTCLPATAAQDASAGKRAAGNGRDPFASYNTELSVAASQALTRVDAPAPVTTAAGNEAAKMPGGMQLRALGPRGKLQAARARVERLLPVIGPILRKAGIPVQLAAVVLVESGGDPTALSPKGARGLWQLMPGTAREYGLIVNGEVDQRLDVVKSTRAAAEYLRDLYAEFGNWKLALAAYNAGDEAVHRAMEQTGGVGFVTARRALPVETQSYVPAVLHALGWFGGSALSPPARRATVQEVAYATDK